MKLKEYVENILNIVDNHPDFLDLDVVYSIDDEGNRFESVYCFPDVGYFDDGEFTSSLDADNWEDNNAICIN